MFKEIISNCVAAVNTVGDHVWAMLLVGVGALLVAIGHKDVGELIVGGGLALFRGQQK
jgi:hypothetical protein